MKKILFLAALFIFCVGICCFSITFPDYDIWARLIAGEYAVENLSILKQDFLSYTKTHFWYDHEWGASVIFYLTLKYFGSGGLVLLKGIISFLTMFFCYKTIEVRISNKNNALNFFYYALLFWVVSVNLGGIIRCLLFTCLFFSIFIYILERYRVKKDKSLFILPVLMLFWCNIHGGCISAFGLLGIYIVGEFLNKKPVLPYIYVLLACFFVLFINPYGIEYVKFLFFAAGMDRARITEWLSPFDLRNTNNYLRYKLYLIFMLLTQIIFIIKSKITYQKLDKTKLLIIIAMTYLSITHLRHITFFVFTAGTLLYEEFYYIVNLITNIIKTKNSDFNESVTLFKEVAVYSILLIITLPCFFNYNKILRITETQYPRYAVEFIKINKLKGNLFINFDWGSYAGYKLYPDNLIVMDGRYEEVYYPDLLNDMNNFHMVTGDWDKIIREYKTDVMVLEKKYPVYNKILESSDWKIVFDNNIFGVFVPALSVKKEYKYPSADDNYYNSTIFKKNK